MSCFVVVVIFFSPSIRTGRNAGALHSAREKECEWFIKCVRGTAKSKKPTLAIKRGEHLLIQLIHNSGNIQICLNAVNLLTGIQLEAKRVSVNIEINNLFVDESNKILYRSVALKEFYPKSFKPNSIKLTVFKEFGVKIGQRFSWGQRAEGDSLSKINASLTLRRI